MPTGQNRIEREIEELLEKIDDFPAESARIRARRRSPRYHLSRLTRAARSRIPRLTASTLLITGLALVFFSYLVLLRLNIAAGQAGIVIGIALFVAAFLASFRPRGVPRNEKRWRGQIIETGRPSWRDRLRGRHR